MTTKTTTIVILGAGLIAGYFVINYLRKPIYYTYEVLEKFSVEYYNNSTKNNKIATFTKGQIIHAKHIPVDNIVTTPDGKIESQPLAVVLPEDKIKRII
jgi:hypothetical protein